MTPTPAHKLIIQGRVKLEAQSENKNYWAVGKGNNKITIIQEKTKYGDIYNCSCKSCSIGGESAGMCTFKKSVIAVEVLGIRTKILNTSNDSK